MIDATLSSFERDVIEASMEVPVIVDFWAPWCGPCKQLGPMLERMEREYGGRFRLVKVNSDTNPELVTSFNLKSIPYTVAFVSGNAVAQFSGPQQEGFVRAFVDRLIPNPAEVEHRAAREALAKGQPEIAESYLKNAIALDPAHAGARLDLVSVLAERGEVDAARTHFDVLPTRAEEQSTFSTVSARLEAAEAAAALPPIDQLMGRIRDDENDLEARLELAELLVSQSEFAPAMDELLEILKRDRHFRGGVAHDKILHVFELAADDQELVAEYRSKLSGLLF